MDKVFYGLYMKGDEFNKKFRYRKSAQKYEHLHHCSNPVKGLHDDMKHFNYYYSEGLNIDTNYFSPSPIEPPYGLYFCLPNNNKIAKTTPTYTQLCDIDIPDDANVIVYNNKVQSDKIIISNIREMPLVNELINNKYNMINNFDLCSYYDLKDEYPYLYLKLSEKTLKNSSEAVKKDPWMYVYVPAKFKTKELSSDAFDRCVYVYWAIPNSFKTEQMAPIAVDKCPNFIRVVPKNEADTRLIGTRSPLNLSQPPHPTIRVVDTISASSGAIYQI
jgi:hypothetical protein